VIGTALEARCRTYALLPTSAFSTALSVIVDLVTQDFRAALSVFCSLGRAPSGIHPRAAYQRDIQARSRSTSADISGFDTTTWTTPRAIVGATLPVSRRKYLMHKGFRPTAATLSPKSTARLDQPLKTARVGTTRLGAPMVQSIIFAIVMYLTPSFLLVALLTCREGFDYQPDRPALGRSSRQ
jgi:hypothetical protein